MAGYTIALIWVVGAVLSDYIARKRGVRKTALRTILFAVLGPLAIPFVYMMRVERSSSAE